MIQNKKNKKDKNKNQNQNQGQNPKENNVINNDEDIKEEIKKYKSFVEKALKDKKYFKVIDCDDVELNKKRELKTLNSIKTSSKKSIKKKRRRKIIIKIKLIK